VLELRETPARVITCVADAAAIDALAAAIRAEVLRIAPDEALVVSDAATEDPVSSVEAVASRADPDALVVDASDGWTVWTLEGDAAVDALARLSELPAAEGFAQGRTAEVPAKVLVAQSRVRLLVESMWRESVRERILADCADLGVREAFDARAVSP
jgi:sarcosine oxidase gamma subunit